MPTFIIYCMQFLMSKLLWGSPYSQGSFSYGQARLSVSEPLVASLSHFNPLFFLSDGMNRIALLETTAKPADIVWPSLWELLIWAGVTLICLGIALTVFQRRKTEICGFLGRNKVLNFAVELALGFAAATVVLDLLHEKIPPAAALAVALIAYAAVYAAIELLLNRSLKPVLHGAWKLPIHLALPAAVFVLFATGLFGYESRVPDVSEIERAYVDADYSFDCYDNDWLGPYGGGGNGYGTLSFSANYNLSGALTSERDKALAVELHHSMFDAKEAEASQVVHRRVTVVYE